jgi:Kef-type K+ transport system membrane component KefB
LSPLVVLTGLLALAYFGSILAGGRAIRGYGLPSGTEFLLVGLFLGPYAFGLITRPGLQSFEAITTFALTWLALLTGANYGNIGERRVDARRLIFGTALSIVPMAFAGAAAAGMARLTTSLGGRDLLLLGLGVASVSGETTRHAVRWVVSRYAADGPLTRIYDDVAEADDAAPLLSLAALFALAPQRDALVLSWPRWSLVLATLGIGAAMGATSAALFDVERRENQRWGIILGTALLAVGASMRLGLAAVTTAFVMGLTMSALSRDRADLGRMLGGTERAVMLPALVLAGAHVAPRVLWTFGAVAAAAVAGRVAAKLASGNLLVRVAEPAARPQWAGLGMMPAGILTLTAGLACALRFPGVVGDLVLAIAALHTLLGELVGPAMLRRTLRIAGEISADSTATPLAAPRHARFRDRRASHRGRGSRASLPDFGGEDVVHAEDIRTTTGHRPRGADDIRASAPRAARSPSDIRSSAARDPGERT